MNTLSLPRAFTALLAVSSAYACGGDPAAPGTGMTPVSMTMPSAGTSSGTAPKAGGASPTAGATSSSGAAGKSAADPLAGKSAPTSVGGMGAPTTPPTAAGGSTATAAGSGTAGSGGLAAVSGGAPAAGGMAPPTSSAGKLPVVMTTDGVGPFKEVVKVKNTPPGGWMIYPKEIGKDGIKHPLFIFGPGGGTTPMTYETDGMHWDRYGSYGFVIYVLPMSTGDGAAMKSGLDWLIKQNDDMSSPLYQKLDTAHVCAAGHSQGSITTFAFMPDDRVTTTVHISGGSFDGMGPSKLKKDTMFLCGPDGSADVAFPQCETDFKNSKVPTFYTNIQGSTHLTSGRLGWAGTIAWMLWHLADQEAQWKKEFLDPSGQFQKGVFKSQTKNWQ